MHFDTEYVTYYTVHFIIIHIIILCLLIRSNYANEYYYYRWGQLHFLYYYIFWVFTKKTAQGKPFKFHNACDYTIKNICCSNGKHFFHVSTFRAGTQETGQRSSGGSTIGRYVSIKQRTYYTANGITHFIINTLTDETKPTVKQLDNKLSDLVYWERFALHLPQITQTDIDIIKREVKDDITGQKQALFNKWLRVYPSASWEHVILALETVDENCIAQTILHCLPETVLSPQKQLTPHEEIIQEAILLTLSELHRLFASLSFQCEKAIKNLVSSKEITLTDLVQRAMKEKAYNLTRLSAIQTVDEFLLIINKHYHFLDSYLLIALAEEFLNPSQILDKLQEQEEKIRYFKRQTNIQSLYQTLQPFVIRSSNEAPVTIRVQNAWKHNKMCIWLVETLLQALFHLREHEIPKWFRVIPGSLTIVFLVPQHKLLLLTELSKNNLLLLRLTGVFTLQVGEEYILQDEENEAYSFTQAFIEATEADNYQAVQFLVQQVCVDVNTQITNVKEISFDEVLNDQNNNRSIQPNSGTTALMIACCNHSNGIIKLLLKNDANPDLQTKIGLTALMLTCRLGYCRIAELLLEHNASIDKSDNDGWTALTHASFEGNSQVIQILGQHSVNVNIKTKKGTTPLHIASYQGHSMVVEKLLKLKADVNATDNYGQTPLFIASLKGHVQVIKMLLRAKANPLASNKSRVTPLHAASLNCHVQVVETLLEAGADLNATNKDKVTPLYKASSYGYSQIVDRLLESNADPNIPADNGTTPLYIASSKGYLPIVESLVNSKADPNISATNGTTPIFTASYEGYLPIVERLLNSKADPNIPADNGTTPLFIASEFGHLQVVIKLLEAKADPNVPMNDGTTPLYIASEKGHSQIVAKLLQNKADPNVSKDDGATPLYIASQKGYSQIVIVLLESKADPIIPTNDKSTPLLVASANGHYRVVQLLLNYMYHADPTVMNYFVQTAIKAATRNGHRDIVKLLKTALVD